MNPLEYLSTQQKADLKQVLSEFTKLFDGTLGVYPHQKFHIELEPGAKPRHARSYHVPVIHLEAFKKELIHLCEIGVIRPQDHKEQANGLLLPLSHPKKMAEFIGLVT